MAAANEGGGVAGIKKGHLGIPEAVFVVGWVSVSVFRAADACGTRLAWLPRRPHPYMAAFVVCSPPTAPPCAAHMWALSLLSRLL